MRQTSFLIRFARLMHAGEDRSDKSGVNVSAVVKLTCSTRTELDVVVKSVEKMVKSKKKF